MRGQSAFRNAPDHRNNLREHASCRIIGYIQGIAGRVDILEIEQFIATNVYALSQFKTAQRRVTVERLIERYNEVVEACETDPSLKVSLG